MAITRYFFKRDKPVASVCRGVEIPAYVGVAQGRTVAYRDLSEHKDEVLGAIFAWN